MDEDQFKSIQASLSPFDLRDSNYDSYESMIEELSKVKIIPWYQALIHQTKNLEERFGPHKWQLCHSFFHNGNVLSEYFYLVVPILEKLKIERLIRVKANLTENTKNTILYPFHTDISSENGENIEDFKTAIYYVNTCDGYTQFKSGEKVECISNRIVLFDGNLLHAGSSTTDANWKCVINFNFLDTNDY